MSHEMKAPVRTIQMLSGTLLDQGFGNINLATKFLQHIKTSTHMLFFNI